MTIFRRMVHVRKSFLHEICRSSEISGAEGWGAMRNVNKSYSSRNHFRAVRADFHGASALHFSGRI